MHLFVSAEAPLPRIRGQPVGGNVWPAGGAQAGDVGVVLGPTFTPRFLDTVNELAEQLNWKLESYIIVT